MNAVMETVAKSKKVKAVMEIVAMPNKVNAVMVLMVVMEIMAN